jgi:signal recognition particle subunit SEC65
MAKSQCVPKPTIQDIANALKTLGVPFIVEDKAYPRDWLVRGRIRLNETTELSSKPAIMKRICELVALSRVKAETPNHPSSGSQSKKKGKK